MGKNSFLGGSTILNLGSSFFSRGGEPKKENGLNEEKYFLLRCIRAEIESSSYPLRFGENEKLQKAILKSGGVAEWVKLHPDYNTLKKQEMKNRKNKRPPKKIKEQKNKSNTKQTETVEQREKREKNELKYLNDFVWTKILGRASPTIKPKGFSKKYPTDEALTKWAINHKDFEQVHTTLLQKRKAQLAKFDIATNQKQDT